MDEPDWREEQRSVLALLFHAAFKRREVPEKALEAEIHLLSEQASGKPHIIPQTVASPDPLTSR
jgi:hypothetical protein